MEAIADYARRVPPADVSPDPFPPRRSEDGRIEVRFSAYEARMSIWVLEPTVVRTRDDRVVVSLDGTGWDAATGVAFPRRDQVRLALRHYPDGTNVEHVVVDVEAERFGHGADAVPTRPLGELAATLEEAREATVARDAGDLLARGVCPSCQARLYVGRLDRLLRRRTVTCLVCERTWPIPPRGNG